jgi:hypothetical protein
MQSPVQDPSFVNKAHVPSMMASSQTVYQQFGSVQQPYQMPPLQNPQIAALQPDQIALPPSTPTEYLPPQAQFHQQPQQGRTDNTEFNSYQSQMQQQPSCLSPPLPPPPVTGVTNCGVAYSLLNQFMPGKTQTEIDMVTSRICPPGRGGCCGEGGTNQTVSGSQNTNNMSAREVAHISIPVTTQWDSQAGRTNERATNRGKLERCEVDNNTLFEVLDSLG